MSEPSRAYPALPLRGAKGKKQKQHVPVEASDTLRSDQVGEIIDLICEGPIEGWATGVPADDVLLDDTPLRSFSGVTVELRTGEIDQTPFENFPGTQDVIAVNERVITYNAVSRVINDTDVDRLLVQLYTPRLMQQNKKNGDINPYELRFMITLREVPVGQPPGDWVTVDSGTIRGKTRSGYGWTRTINVSQYTNPVEVSVARTSGDDIDSSTASELYFSSITVVKDLKLSCPGSAMIAMRVRADEFEAVPARAYRLKLKKVLVPTNYDPLTRQYAGDWDGTFKGPFWTNNPAWCLYDLALDERGSIGEFLRAANIDKWSLYDVARYCDEQVPSGRKDIFGNDILEPRFTLNGFWQEQAEAYKVFLDIASVFRGLLFWMNGKVSFTFDALRDPSHHFTPANVVDGLFIYQHSSRRARHTVVKVRWNDPDNSYLPLIEYVEDQTGIAKYGYIMRDATAIGCTSRGQARRLGRWLLFTEALETETVTFVTGLEAMGLLPGEVFTVSDPVRTGERMGGRLRSSSVDEVEVDAPVTLEAGSSYDLMVLYPDIVEEFTAPDSVSQLTISRSPDTLVRDQIHVYADFDNDGVFETRMETSLWLPGMEDTSPGTVKFVPWLGGSSADVKWRVRYPQRLATRAVQAPPVTRETTTLVLTTPLVEAAPANSVWILAKHNEVKQLYRLLTIDERGGSRFELTGFQYDPDKFALIEQNLLLDDDVPPVVSDDPRLANAAVTAIAFELEVRSTADGTRAVLHFHWQHERASFQRGYAVRYRVNQGEWHRLLGSGSDGFWPQADAFVYDVVPGLYEVEVTAVNLYGRQSAAVRAEYEVGEVDPIDAVRVTLVELANAAPGQPSVFQGHHAEFTWLVNTETAIALTDDSPATGLDVEVGESTVPYIKDFVVRVYADTEPLHSANFLREDVVPVTAGGRGAYTYTFEKNIVDGLPAPGGRTVPRRRFRVEIAARDPFRRTGPFSYITVENPAPPALRAIDPLATFDTFWLRFTQGTPDSDQRGVILWASATGPDFPLTRETQVAIGGSSPLSFEAPLVGQVYYVRAAAFDDFFPIDTYGPGDAEALLNVTSAVSDETPFIDGAVDIKRLSIGEAQLQDAVIGTAKIKDLAVKTALIDDLAVNTLKIAGNAVTQVQERTLTPRTIIDSLNGATPKGVWQFVEEVEITTGGGPVLITALLFSEVVHVYPAFDTFGEPIGQRSPIVRYRVLRMPGNIEVFRSGKISISVAGYYFGGLVTRVDQPPPGRYTYRIEFQHLLDYYEAGLASAAGISGGRRFINGIGTRWVKNIAGPGGGANADQFTWLDNNGDPTGTPDLVFNVVDDDEIVLVGDVVALNAATRYRLTKRGLNATTLIIDLLEGYAQLLELRR